jgi:hypothetical protein
MARGFRERRKREAAKRRLAVLKWMLLIGGLAGLGWIAYAAGSELARHEVRKLEEQIVVLEGNLSGRVEEAETLLGQRDDALERLTTLQSRYEKDAPTGKPREIFELMRQQLDSGVSEDRLRFLIGTAGEAVRCDGNPEEKRFIVQTGLTRGKNDWVAFAGQTVVVRAKGEPVKTSDGRAQAWFNEEQPVTVTFTKIDGGESEAVGILPLHHSVIRGANEYRFVLTKSTARGFLQITSERCRLPSGR